MSRIHEALKKAAQERSAQLAAGLEAGVAEVAGEIRRSVPQESHVVRPAAPSRVVAAGNRTVPLRYEELVKRCAHPEWRLDPLNNVFQNAKTGYGGSERFRTLRSRLYQIAGTRTLRRLLVTSSVAAEGKTLVASNLAQSIVQQPEQRVLLLDADLRASRLHQALGAPSQPGLADYLRGDADEFEVIQKGTEENLCLIPGGRRVSNPSELLLSERMNDLLNCLTPIFDWIIIDSPPALPVHDASILADLANGVLLVVQAGSTHVDDAERAAQEFQNKNVVGVVLNQVEKSDFYGDRHYSYDTQGV